MLQRGSRGGAFGWGSALQAGRSRVRFQRPACFAGQLIHYFIDWLRGRTKTRMAAILRIHPKHIPGEWTIRPNFHYWPPPTEAGGDNMDRGPSSSLPSPDTATPISCRLHGFSETSPMERLPSSNQDTHSRKVHGCAIEPPPSHLHQIRYSRIQRWLVCPSTSLESKHYHPPTPQQGLTKSGGDTV